MPLPRADKTLRLLPLLMSCLVVAACGGGGEAAPEEAAAAEVVTTTTLALQPWNDRIRALGTVKARESVTVTAKVSETVRSVRDPSEISTPSQPEISATSVSHS